MQREKYNSGAIDRNYNVEVNVTARLYEGLCREKIYNSGVKDRSDNLEIKIVDLPY